MLIALANADRLSDLVALDFTYRSYSGNGVRFVFPGLTRTRGNGPPMDVFYSAFPKDPKLSPVQTLCCYEKGSKGLRSKAMSTPRSPPFISVCWPHKPVKAATIGHWLRR